MARYNVRLMPALSFPSRGREGAAFSCRSDYVSPNLRDIRLHEAFPHMCPGNVESIAWPYLRSEIKHTFYVDSRQPNIGFLNRDESVLLYNLALPFAGMPCLEIGCWRGWSAAHIATATGMLDVVDPVLNDAEFRADVCDSLARAGLAGRVKLYGGRSPSAVDKIAALRNRSWPFAFIDGDHEGRAPVLDAAAVAAHAAESAMIVFHDLASPHVAAGLAYLGANGWRTRIYHTMQIMGAAWRGDVEPVEHIPDPGQSWTLPAHLSE